MAANGQRVEVLSGLAQQAKQPPEHALGTTKERVKQVPHDEATHRQEPFRKHATVRPAILGARISIGGTTLVVWLNYVALIALAQQSAVCTGGRGYSPCGGRWTLSGS